MDANAQFRKGLRGQSNFGKPGQKGEERAEARKEAFREAMRERGIQQFGEKGRHVPGQRQQEEARKDDKRKNEDRPREALVNATRQSSHYLAIMQRFDLNRDGMLDKSEAESCQKARMESISRREVNLRAFDLNKDGELSDSEAAAIPRR